MNLQQKYQKCIKCNNYFNQSNEQCAFCGYQLPSLTFENDSLINCTQLETSKIENKNKILETKINNFLNDFSTFVNINADQKRSILSDSLSIRNVQSKCKSVQGLTAACFICNCRQNGIAIDLKQFIKRFQLKGKMFLKYLKLCENRQSSNNESSEEQDIQNNEKLLDSNLNIISCNIENMFLEQYDFSALSGKEQLLKSIIQKFSNQVKKLYQMENLELIKQGKQGINFLSTLSYMVLKKILKINISKAQYSKYLNINCQTLKRIKTQIKLVIQTEIKNKLQSFQTKSQLGEPIPKIIKQLIQPRKKTKSYGIKEFCELMKSGDIESSTEIGDEY